MLGKIIKYDIKATWRDFAGIFMCIILGVIIVPLMIKNVNNTILNMLAGFIAFGIFIAVIVVVIANLFKIYNTNVFAKEGYLTMTLPVNARQIVFSKLIVSSGWLVMTGLVSAIGISIFAILISPDQFLLFTKQLSEVISTFDGMGILGMVLLVVSMIASALKEVAKLFLACTIAHLKQLNRFRVPVGILSYFAFSWIEALIVELASRVISFMPMFSDAMIARFEQMTSAKDLAPFMDVFTGALAIGITYSLILTAAYAFSTIWLLNHKLDLD